MITNTLNTSNEKWKFTYINQLSTRKNTKWSMVPVCIYSKISDFGGEIHIYLVMETFSTILGFNIFLFSSPPLPPAATGHISEIIPQIKRYNLPWYPIEIYNLVDLQKVHFGVLSTDTRSVDCYGVLLICFFQWFEESPRFKTKNGIAPWGQLENCGKVYMKNRFWQGKWTCSQQK